MRRTNPEYWGRTAAGILFTCVEDDTMLLMYRSADVDEPFTWGIPGGAVTGDGWFDSDRMTVQAYEDRTLWDGAKEEVVQECSSLPYALKESDIVTTFDFRDGSFLYRNFVIDLTLQQKRNWKIDIVNAEDDWENDDWGWFHPHALPRPLHFGVRDLLDFLNVSYSYR